MKKLANLKGVKTLSRNDQKFINGGYVLPISCGDIDVCSSGICLYGQYCL